MAKVESSMGFMVKRPNPRGGFILATTRGAWATRASARKAFVKTLGRSWTWKKCYAAGCRVTFVNIKEI